MISRPMLAARAKTLDDLRFPLLVTPKIDGVRCLRVGDSVLSRAFKPIPNKFISSLVGTLPEGLDGELITGEFNDTTSGVMSHEGEPSFTYAVFDTFAVEGDYWDRTQYLSTLMWPSWVTVLTPTVVANMEEFLAMEKEYLFAGYEGVIGRCARGPYYEGRCSLRQHYMVKWKRYADDEAVIVGIEEGKTNINPQVPNAFGYMRRPGGSSGHIPNGTLGSLRVRDLKSGVEFSIGTGIGLDDELRAAIWADPIAYIGKIVRYKHQSVGKVKKPRFPSFQGFRDERDMS